MSSSFISKDQQFVWHPFTPFEGLPAPVEIVRGSGALLFTREGKTIIDAISSWWVNLHGHANPVIAAAIAQQAASLEHVIFAGLTHQPAIELAEKLIIETAWPSGKCFFSDNGSTAVEVALKIALQFFHNKGERRTKVIALQGAYHGDTFGAMAVGERSPFNAPFGDKLFEVQFLTVPYCQNPIEQNLEKEHDATLQSFERLLDSGDVAAFVFEPLVQGASGMNMYPAKLLNELLKYCKAQGIITIADEVMTGFGRTGKTYASQHLDTFPDLICLSKGITGGFLPLGATLVSEHLTEPFRVNDLLKTFFHGHSYTANPIACAAANASFDLLMLPQTQNAIHQLTEKLEAFARELHGHQAFNHTRHIGGILATACSTEGATGYFNEARNRLNQYFLEKGILLRPLGNVLYLIPPYVIDNEQLDYVFDCMLQMPENVG